MYEYIGTVIRVVDGDTFDAVVDLGFKISTAQRFRLADFDAPESWRPKSDAEREHGERAKEYLAGLIEGKNVRILSHKLGVYNRYSCDVFYQKYDQTLDDQIYVDWVNVVEEMKSKGFEKLDTY